MTMPIPFLFLRRVLVCACFLCIVSGVGWAQVMSAPAGQLPTSADPGGRLVIPNGRILTPAGNNIRVAPHPYGLIVSPDGRTIVTANSGTSPISLSIIDSLSSGSPRVRQVPPGAGGDEGVLASCFMGLAFSPDSRWLYVAGGQENAVFVFDPVSGRKEYHISCARPDAGPAHPDGYIGDMVLSRDGTMLYAVDQINFCVVVIDVRVSRALRTIPVGRYPFGITLSPDGKALYVANVGMYAYSLVRSLDSARIDETALTYPAYGYLSPASVVGVKNDSVDIPPLGDPHAPESFSVWVIDTRTDSVMARVKTGIQVGEPVEGFPAVGGSSPNSVVATERFVFVSNGSNDCISVIDAMTQKVVRTIPLFIDERLHHLRGVIPFGLALSPDRKRLYVAESGINAVGVIDLSLMRVIGHIPTAWFPSKLAVLPDGKTLVVANAKGYGSGPNAGSAFVRGPEGSGIGGLMKGVVSVIPIPSDNALPTWTSRVLENTVSFAGSRRRPGIGLPPKRANGPPITHIVFISKENRTYDEVFGQLAGGNGDPSLARFGAGVTVTNKKGERAEKCTVMRNHLALAKRFAIADNFYCDSDHSADGHRWLVSTYPNEWTETSVTASYGGMRDMNMRSTSPGMGAFVGSSGAIYPEDYNEAGSLWDHLHRNGREFFNFGFGTELAPSYEKGEFKRMGVRYLFNHPLPGPLFERSSHEYPTFNMAIPDQYRVDCFMREFNERWNAPGKTMPSVVTLILPQDHGSSPHPESGYPFLESYMADNDLALGRIVEFLSHTRFWQNMLIVVTEDDPQGGVDHVDAHRSVLMVISPYVRPGWIGHDHYSFGSIFKTFWTILGIPPLNQFDATANDLSDLFMATPDLRPYRALPVDERIFRPQDALTPLHEKFDWKALQESPGLDDEAELQRQRREFDENGPGRGQNRPGSR
jgi:YVTN family beta-propeller protein